MKKRIIVVTAAVALFIAACIAIFFLRDKKIVIKFDSDGGTIVQSVQIKEGDSIELPTTTKEGFIFNGWYLENTKVSNKTIFSKDTTLKANWLKENAKTLNITFDSEGGTKVEDIILECGKELVLPANPTKNGYKFLAWIDKHGTPIYDKALLACEDIVLRASWEKETKKDEKETNPPKKENKETKEPVKTYTCPSGYILDRTKCTIEGTVKEKCPSDTSVDGNLCIKLSDYSKGTRQCKQETVILDNKGHTYTGRGEYYEVGLGICGYYVWTELTTQQQCTSASTKNTVWSNNKCYAKTINNNYETVCSGDYQYYSSSELSSKFSAHNNGGCYKKVDKAKYCDEDYVLTNGKCIKTIDATLK